MAKRTQVAIVYHTDGTTSTHRPANKRTFTPHELQHFVGGYIESLIPANKKCKQMYANEEGFSLNLPPNPHTQTVCDMRVYRLNGYPSNWRVVGPIVAVMTEDAADAAAAEAFQRSAEAYVYAAEEVRLANEVHGEAE
jgi:hypothetical protein